MSKDGKKLDSTCKDSSSRGKRSNSNYDHVESSHYGSVHNWKKIQRERRHRETTRQILDITRDESLVQSEDLIEKMKLISELERKNQLLETKLRDQQEEIIEMTSYYESKFHDKDDQIERLKKDIVAQQVREKENFNHHVSTSKVEKERLETKITQLSGLLENKNNESQSSRLFQEQRQNLEMRIKILDEAVKSSAFVHNEQICELERKHSSLISSMKTKMNGLCEEIRHKARHDAFSELDHLVSSAPVFIEKLFRELQCQLDVVDSLYEKLQERSIERDDLIQTLERYKKSEKEYIKQQKNLLKEKLQLETKIIVLTRELKSLSDQFKHDEFELQMKLRTQREESLSEVRKIKALLVEKDNEVQDLKCKAEDILSRRTVVEMFLVDALLKVKEQNHKNSQGNSHMHSNLSTTDIDDISLEQRENIVRKMLALMNKNV